MMEEVEGLARENELVLLACQASLRLIGPELIALAVRADAEDVVLTAWVRTHTDELSCDVDEILDELDILLQDFDGQIRSEVHVGRPPTNWHTWAGRMFFWAKD